MKIKKLKIKLNKDNEYSDYRYFIPKSNNIKMTDGRDVDEAVQSLKDKIANLKEQANYLINKAPLVKYAEGSNIAAAGCANEPLRKFTLEGDSYQKIRQESYNLIDVIELGGINYNTGELDTNMSAIRCKNYIPIDTNLKYCFSRNLAKTTLAIGLRYYDENYEYLGAGQLAENAEFIILNLANTSKDAAKYFKFTAATIILDGDYMFTQSDTLLPYKPYGLAPTLEHAAIVNSVGDNINLFNKDVLTDQLINWQTGTIANNSAWKLSDYISVTPLTNYTFSWDSTHQYFQVRIHMFDKNKQFLGGLRYELSHIYQKTFATYENCVYVRVNYSINVSGQEAVRTNIKLEHGIRKTVYSPYLNGAVRVYNFNKNLLHRDTIKQMELNGITFIPQEDGGILINGTATGDANFPILGRAWDATDRQLIFENNEYYTIGKGTANAIVYCRDGINNINNATPLNGVKSINNMSCITYAYIQVQKGRVVNNEVIYPMIVKGKYDVTNFPEFIKNQGQLLNIHIQESFKAIGTIKDRFVYTNNEWYEEHNIDKIILDNSQTITKGDASIQEKTIYVVISHINEGLSASALNCLCENLPAYTASYLWTNDVEGIGQSQSQIVLRLNRERANTLEDVKTLIQSNPITIYTRRIEPRLIPCTSEQSAALNNLYSFYGKTHLYIENMENIQSQLKMIYKQDINAILEEKGV